MFITMMYSCASGSDHVLYIIININSKPALRILLYNIILLS